MLFRTIWRLWSPSMSYIYAPCMINPTVFSQINHPPEVCDASTASRRARPVSGVLQVELSFAVLAASHPWCVYNTLCCLPSISVMRKRTHAQASDFQVRIKMSHQQPHGNLSQCVSLSRAPWLKGRLVSEAHITDFGCCSPIWTSLCRSCSRISIHASRVCLHEIFKWTIQHCRVLNLHAAPNRFHGNLH